MIHGDHDPSALKQSHSLMKVIFMVLGLGNNLYITEHSLNQRPNLRECTYKMLELLCKKEECQRNLQEPCTDVITQSSLHA